MDKNSSSLIILTPSSFAFLFLEEAEVESLLIRSRVVYEKEPRSVPAPVYIVGR